MKKLLAILALVGLLFASGCVFGVYQTANQDTLDKDIKAGGGWYWYDGHDSLDECAKAWNANK